MVNKNAFEPKNSSASELVRLQREYAETNKAIVRVNNEIKKALEHEEQAQRTLKEAVKAAILAVKDTPSEGVTITSTSPLCGTIRFSTIKGNGLVLSPEFYLQESQARLVQNKLKKAKTVNQVLGSIKDMVDTGRVHVTGTTYQLNRTTIDVLKQFLPD